MSYIYIILVILLVLTVLFFINNKAIISYDNAWIKLVKNRVVKEADRYYSFNEYGVLTINKKNTLNFIQAKHENMAVYSNTDYLNKFMLVFSGYPSIKVTFMEGYIVENNKLYYTYAYKSSYYTKLNKWMKSNGVFENKENWVAKKNVKWNTFPCPQSSDINWEKKAMIGILS
ncbi:hypothetical protein A966_12106 [Brachyspira hampsonii 30446]|uniref:Uncharacterized protein n=1 Tax=Brachyspira hampsonii 30446 TaxID=1289135 RepID=A0A2U4F9Y0_9SPIR|nr:hypothetical protein A966_12106 [Brachyspira hampsonii 30446]MBW5395934.1 hypothetical protein [Brachyspira hampsonii]OEJ18054.1 hypothetical protein A9495_06510 [Brachyspira hampsonii]